MLKLNGKPFEIRPPAPSIEQIRTFLDAQPEDDLFSFSEMTARMGAGKDSLIQAGKVLHEYTRLYKQRRYWGNPKAIVELNRRLNEVG